MTDPTDPTDDKSLRLRLADQLVEGGHLRTVPWRTAVEDVPRHEYLRGGYFERVDGPGPTAWTPVLPDDPRWLARCYADESLVTQIAGTIAPPGRAGGDPARAHVVAHHAVPGGEDAGRTPGRGRPQRAGDRHRLLHGPALPSER
ncbi:hypothetical protein GCM10022227_01970 [Streptomyces sedi]